MGRGLLAVYGAALFGAVMFGGGGCAGGPAGQRLATVQRLLDGDAARVVALGDSITQENYHTHGEPPWPGLLAARLPGQAEVVNCGVSGHTTVNGLVRLPWPVMAQQPDLVVIAYGMNDVVQVPVAEYDANLRALVAGVRAGGAEVALCNAPWVDAGVYLHPQETMALYAATVRTVGAELRCPVADWYAVTEAVHAADAAGWATLMNDAIHPNAAGQVVLAETVAAALLGWRE